MIYDKKITAEKIIQKYKLEPHIEGGYAQLMYEDESILTKESLPQEFNGPRPFWNGIYFLLPKNNKSILHRLKMNELWNFYLGDPLELYQISPEGECSKIILGNDICAGQQLAYVFPKNYWIGAKPADGSDFCFVSCVSAPGFTFADWEKGKREVLLNKYPTLQETILMLTD